MIHNYFEILKESDITDNVVHSLRLDTTRMSRFADENVPIRKHISLMLPFIVMNTLFKQFWGLEGTIFYSLLANKTFIYKSFVLRKKHMIAKA